METTDACSAGGSPSPLLYEGLQQPLFANPGSQLTTRRARFTVQVAVHETRHVEAPTDGNLAQSHQPAVGLPPPRGSPAPGGETLADVVVKVLDERKERSLSPASANAAARAELQQEGRTSSSTAKAKTRRLLGCTQGPSGDVEGDVAHFKPRELPWSMAEEDQLEQHVMQHDKSGSELPLSLGAVSKALLRHPADCRARVALMHSQGILKIPVLPRMFDEGDVLAARIDSKGSLAGDLDAAPCGSPVTRQKTAEFKPLDHSGALPPQGEVVLSDEQQFVFDLVVHKGRSVFITGGAGCGKSALLKQIIAELKSRNNSKRIAVTASTGIAATPLNGETLHHFSGFKPMHETWDPMKLAKELQTSRFAVSRWRQCKVLIVDEVSMVQGRMLDQLDKVAKVIRSSNAPFGGIQVIFCGDFLQLPPVHIGRGAPDYGFDCSAWRNAGLRVCLLTKPFRQRDDAFVRMLNEIRVAKLSPQTDQWLRAHSHSVTSVEEQLDFFGKPVDMVEVINIDALSEEDGEGESAVDRSPTGAATPPVAQPLRAVAVNPQCNAVQICAKHEHVDRCNLRAYQRIEAPEITFRCFDAVGRVNDKDTLAPPELRLKIGTKVMLLKNLDRVHVNGTTGHVVGFISIVQTEHLEATSFVRASVIPKVTAGHRTLPIVRFGDRNKILLPASFSHETADGKVIWERFQVPLRHAWSMTIHKSQGMTIPVLNVNFEGLFEFAHAYVALSRCTDLRSLAIFNYDRKLIRAAPPAVKFYDNLACDPTAECRFLHGYDSPVKVPGPVVMLDSPTRNMSKRTSEKSPGIDVTDVAGERSLADVLASMPAPATRASRFERRSFATPWAVGNGSPSKLIESLDPLHPSNAGADLQ